jgi:hypothetical protein
MKKILGLLGLLLCSAFPTFPASAAGLPSNHYPELGGGFNGYLGDIDNALILTSGIKWARAYINIQRNFLTFTGCPGSSCTVGVLSDNINGAQSDPNDDAASFSSDEDVLAVYAVDGLVAAKSVGCQPPPANGTCPPFKIILSLKLDFKYDGAGIPAPNSRYETAIFKAVTQFLTNNNLGSQIDILVLGNEPMYETPLGTTPAESIAAALKYGTFLNRFIDKVWALKTVHPPAPGVWNYDIYTGSLDKPYYYVGPSAKPEWKQTFGPLIQNIIWITARNPKVTGIDLHEHVMSVDAAAGDVDYVNGQIFRAGAIKKIISTEFSLVPLWDSVLNGPAAGTTPTLCNQVNQMIASAAAGTPVTFDDFQSYLAAQSWYPAAQNGNGWFAQFYCMFQRRPNVYAVTYGLEKAPQYPYTLDLLATVRPAQTQCVTGDQSWVMVSAYDGTLMGLDRNRASPTFGRFNANPLVFPDFANVLNSPAKTCAGLSSPRP